MSKVVFDISMSLDGFITAANRRPDQPLGDEGEQLHNWALNNSDKGGRKMVEETVRGAGAVIAGRRTYDDSMPGWGADGPTGAARLPVFVVSHSVPKDIPEGGVYTFVTDGIEKALQRAKAVAGDKNISVMGGAAIGQQYLRAGLIDEIQIHLAPVLFGGGLRMFEHMEDGQIELETIEVIKTEAATHLRFRVVK